MSSAVSLSHSSVSAHSPASVAGRTSDRGDGLPAHTTRRGVDKLKRKFAEVAEVCTAFDDEDVAAVCFGTEHGMRCVVTFPRGDTVRDVIEMVVSAKDEVHAVCHVPSGAVCLAGGRKRADGFCKCDVLVAVCYEKGDDQVARTFGTLIQALMSRILTCGKVTYRA